MTSSTTTPGSKVGRARRRLGQLWQVPTFLVGLLAILGAAVSAPWRPTPQEREFEKYVTSLRIGLDQQEPGDLLVAHAENIRLRMHAFRSRDAEVHFLIGSAYFRQAQQKPAVYAREVWPRAVEHLEKALAAGPSATDRFALQYRLGFSLYQQKTEVPRALELMTLGVEKGAEQPLQGYQLLVKAHLERTPPNVDGALSANGRILDLTPERETETVALARLQHAELLLRKDLRADAIKELGHIGPKASRPVRVKAKLLQARCCEEDGQWAKAISIWQELLAEAAHLEGGRARICYALGLCYLQLEPANPVEATRAWSEALRLGGPAGQAAGLRLGELRLGGPDPAQALADWKTALEKVNGPNDFRNPYLELKQVAEWFDQAIRKFQQGQDPQKTQAVAELYRKIAPGGAAELKIGEAALANARLLADKRKSMPDNVTPAEVQAQYRRAGEAFEHAAKARPEAERAEVLWRSAECFLAAKAPTLAQPILRQFVALEMNETRLAEGWQTLGDLYRTEGKTDIARTAYLKCIEYPNTRFAYQARYFLALDEIDKKNYEQAREILKQNLRGDAIDIERTWQEKSQYTMATVLMLMEDHGQAHVHLKDFLRLFSESSDATLARDQLGECYRRLAVKEQLEETKLQGMIKADMPEDQRLTLELSLRHHRKTRMGLLSEAVKVYQGMTDELEARARTKPLSNQQQRLLRRAWFGIADCLLDGKEYGEALRTFQELQKNHRRTVEGFYACHRLCYMVDETQPQPLAKKQLEQIRASAKESIGLLIEDVQAMPADHEVFRLPRVPPRDDWLRWAEATQRVLQAPPRNDSGLPAFR